MPIPRVAWRIAAVLIVCSVCNLLLGIAPAFICDLLWWATERPPSHSSLCEYWWVLSYIIMGMASGYSLYVIHTMAIDARRVAPAPVVIATPVSTVPRRLPPITETA